MPDNMEKNILIVFVKLPEPGSVKTRLAKDLGNERAAEIYSDIAKDIVSRVSKSNQYDTYIFYDPPNRGNDLKLWLSDIANIDNERMVPQEGDSLGERISNAFETVFSSGAKRAVIIGSDCTDVTAAMIEESFSMLSHSDAVLGPAEDGGYYLLGLKRFIPELFEDIDWSTERVLEQTVSRLANSGLKYRLLKTLRDIDNLNDLRNHLKNIDPNKESSAC